MNSQLESLPIGSIVAYAGQLNNAALMSIGWSICNGTQFPIKDYKKLFDVLGTTNGGDGDTYFNLPNYQGLFLRSLDPTGNIDKGAFNRTAPASGAASGENVGSLEGFATACPQSSPFQAQIPHIPKEKHRAYTGTEVELVKKTPHSQQAFSSTGSGDAETRPINAYVNFIIQITTSALMPVGSVIPFAGDIQNSNPASDGNYLYCDGNLLAQSAQPTLFNAVGSVQLYATAKPISPFQISMEYRPDSKDSDHCDGHDESEFNSASTNINLTDIGGDKESRPVNVYVDYYILSAKDTGKTDIFPVGAIIAFAGNAVPSDQNWLPCTGGLNSATSPQYAALYAAIGNAWGGDSASFNLPSLAGMFGRGTNNGTGRDPDADSRTANNTGGHTGDLVGSQQSYATEKPQGSAIYASVDDLPTKDADTAVAIGANEVKGWNSGTTTYDVTGGGAETRPTNVNVNYCIKYALYS